MIVIDVIHKDVIQSLGTSKELVSNNTSTSETLASVVAAEIREEIEKEFLKGLSNGKFSNNT